jgi:hypothetical protein
MELQMDALAKVLGEKELTIIMLRAKVEELQKIVDGMTKTTSDAGADKRT